MSLVPLLGPEGGFVPLGRRFKTRGPYLATAAAPNLGAAGRWEEEAWSVLSVWHGNTRCWGRRWWWASSCDGFSGKNTLCLLCALGSSRWGSWSSFKSLADEQVDTTSNISKTHSICAIVGNKMRSFLVWNVKAIRLSWESLLACWRRGGGWWGFYTGSEGIIKCWIWKPQTLAARCLDNVVFHDVRG